MASSLIFGTNRFNGNGIERMRINPFGYVGVAAPSPTAKLHVNCVAVSGKTNPSNIRFENLQKGAGAYLVIDSNGYVYRTTSGAGSSIIKQDPLTVELQNQVETLKNQVQELRTMILNRQPLSNLQTNALKSANATWLGNNRPNPSTNSTTIEYSLPGDVNAATCQVYSLDGKLINTVSLSPAAGKGQVQLSTGKLTSGMYIYSLIVNGKVVDTKKMVVSN
ncbi:T9SS type A sorting domain-containing protein [Flavitalea flava]